MKLDDKECVRAFRTYLEDIQLGEVMQAVRPSVPVEDPWPSYHHLELAIAQLPEALRAAFELLVLGKPLHGDVIRGTLGRRIADGLEKIGVLGSEADGKLSTGGRALVPFDGHFVLADLPAFYPTARAQQQQVFVDRSTMFLARILPGVRKRRAIEICSGAGLLSIVAATTAERVVALDINPLAVGVARFNALLNGVEDRLQVLESDLFSAVPGARSDLIISNPPYLALPEGACERYLAGDGGEDGMRIVRRILDQSAEHLEAGGRALVMAACLGTAESVACENELGALARRHRWQIELIPVVAPTIDEYLRLHVINVDDAERFEQETRSYCRAQSLTHYYVFLLSIRPASQGGLRVINGLVPSPQQAREMRRIRDAVDAGRSASRVSRPVAPPPATSRPRQSNEQLMERARQSLPSGDSSTMRVLPYALPLVASHGRGSRVWDVEGKEYIDFNMAYGPLLFGHRPAFVIDRVTRQLQESGSQLGFQSELGMRVAEKVKRHIPSMEQLRFANSGTEAIASAVRLARTATGRSKVIVFEGHYHGWSDAVFHRYHAPLAELGYEHFGPALPGTAGMNGAPHGLLSVRFNRPESLAACFAAHGSDIAAVICEPVMGNAGVIAPAEGFLAYLRELCEQHGSLLIFDEVITGFRLGSGGAQERLGVKPDITVVSKALGAGFPVAAFGASKQLMDLIRQGKTFHGGVYSGNAAVMAAAEAVLDELEAHGESHYAHLYRMGAELAAGLRGILRRHGVHHVVQQVGPMLAMFLTDRPVEQLREYREVRRHCDQDRYTRFQHEAQRRGVYFHPNLFEPLYLSTAHSSNDLAAALESIDGAVQCTLT